MPYRFHPTKRGLYKLVAEKAAELSWLELPKAAKCCLSMANTLLGCAGHITKFTLRRPRTRCWRLSSMAMHPPMKRSVFVSAKFFNFSLADLQAYGLIKEVPSKESCL